MINNYQVAFNIYYKSEDKNLFDSICSKLVSGYKNIDSKKDIKIGLVLIPKNKKIPKTLIKNYEKNKELELFFKEKERETSIIYLKRNGFWPFYKQRIFIILDIKKNDNSPFFGIKDKLFLRQVKKIFKSDMTKLKNKIKNKDKEGGSREVI